MKKTVQYRVTRCSVFEADGARLYLGKVFATTASEAMNKAAARWGVLGGLVVEGPAAVAA